MEIVFLIFFSVWACTIVKVLIPFIGEVRKQRALKSGTPKPQIADPVRVKELEAWNQTFSETLDYDKAEQAGQTVRQHAKWEALPDSRPLPDGTEIRGNAADDRWYTAEGVQVALAGPTGYAMLATAEQRSSRASGSALREATESIKRFAKQGDLQSLKNAKAATVMYMRTLTDVAAAENNRRFTESEEAAWINLNAQLHHYDKTIEAIFNKPKPQSDMIGAGRIIQAFAKLDPAGTPPMVRTSEEMIRCYWKRRAELIAEGRSVPMPAPRFHDAQLNLITEVEPEKHYGYAVSPQLTSWAGPMNWWIDAKFSEFYGTAGDVITVKHYGPFESHEIALEALSAMDMRGTRLVEPPSISRR